MLLKQENKDHIWVSQGRPALPVANNKSMHGCCLTDGWRKRKRRKRKTRRKTKRRKKTLALCCV
tara:strand:- start:77 stop:268 length:192 start_codon:yes stop_codon:yes gene_type:complete